MYIYIYIFFFQGYIYIYTLYIHTIICVLDACVILCAYWGNYELFLSNSSSNSLYPLTSVGNVAGHDGVHQVHMEFSEHFPLHDQPLLTDTELMESMAERALRMLRAGCPGGTLGKLWVGACKDLQSLW